MSYWFNVFARLFKKRSMKLISLEITTKSKQYRVVRMTYTYAAHNAVVMAISNVGNRIMHGAKSEIDETA